MASTLTLTDIRPTERKATASWNPLRVSGTALPVNILLMAKILVLCFLLTGQWNLLPDHFLPFVPMFDHLGSPAIFQRTLQVAFLFAAASLLLNYRVRTCCLILAGIIMAGMLSSRLYFENNRTFTACLWFLAGLYAPGQRISLIRYQVVILYFGAALNKLLDGDWRSGQFFENLVVHLVHQPVYIRLSSWLPALWLSKFFSWSTIIVEFILVAGFLIRRLFLPTVWLGIAYHTTLLLLMGRTFGMFYFATLSSFLAFVDWPRFPMTVVDAGTGEMRSRLRNGLARIDFDGCFKFTRSSTPVTDNDTFHPGVLSGLSLVAPEQTYRGVTALYMILVYNPFTYLLFALAVALPRPVSSPIRLAAASIFLLFVSPALLAPAARLLFPGRGFLSELRPKTMAHTSGRY
jgi:hypothetical protein